MVCNRNGERCANAGRRNGIVSHMNKAVGSMSSWQALDLAAQASRNWQDVPGALTDMGLGMVGMSRNAQGQLRLQNLAGVQLAVHALEYGTSAAATSLIRAGVRGKPYGQYRGVIFRKNPYLPLMQKVRDYQKFVGPLNPRNWYKPAVTDGFYFHQGGQTWSALVTEHQVTPDTQKTLMSVKQIGFPSRGHYFDRRIDERDVADVVLGDRDPETIAGYLGSTNEVDAVVEPFGRAKKALMAANWLLVDDTERDIRVTDRVDYGTMQDTRQLQSYIRRPEQKKKEEGLEGLLTKDEGPASSPAAYLDSSGSKLDPSVNAAQPPPSPIRISESSRWLGGRDTPAETPPTGSKPAADSRQHPVKQTINLRELESLMEEGARLTPEKLKIRGADGQTKEVPLRVDTIKQFKDGTVRAVAYYQHSGRWVPITDDKACRQIAREVIERFNAFDDG